MVLPVNASSVSQPEEKGEITSPSPSGVGSTPSTLQSAGSPAKSDIGYVERGGLFIKQGMIHWFQKIYTLITKKPAPSFDPSPSNQKGYIERGMLAIKTLILHLFKKKG